MSQSATMNPTTGEKMSGRTTFLHSTFQFTVCTPRLAMPAPSKLPMSAWLELLGMP